MKIGSSLLLLLLALTGSVQAQTPERSARRASAGQYADAPAPAWGTQADSVLLLEQSGFLSGTSSQEYEQGLKALSCSPSNSTACSFVAPVRVPTGVSLNWLEVEACDADPAVGQDIQAELWHCVSPMGECTLVAAVTASAGCEFSGVEVLPPGHLTVDNYEHTYRVAVRVGNSSDLGLRAVRLFYRLQVSPAPSLARFDDVPVGHPLFQYVEALSAAGISSGCTAETYCPDSPVTRGQMAMFLARALGLHWIY